MRRRARQVALAAVIVGAVCCGVALLPCALSGGGDAGKCPQKVAERSAGQVRQADHTLDNSTMMLADAPRPAKQPPDTGKFAAPSDGARALGHTATKDESSLDMPESVTQRQVTLTLLRAEKRRIWRAQDDVMRSWPSYADSKAELRGQLEKTANLVTITAADLMRRAVAFRRNFWKQGGGMSPTSYVSAYKARILLELAHERAPNDMNVTDELVETILSAHPQVRYDPAVGKKVRNVEVEKALIELRGGQFAAIRKEVEAGRNPSWKDFTRAVDLAVLQSLYAPDSSRKVLCWLKDNSVRGGWSTATCNNVLDRCLSQLDRRQPFNFNIYVKRKAKRPEETRYARRAPSFRGPEPTRRGLVLWPKLKAEIMRITASAG